MFRLASPYRRIIWVALLATSAAPAQVVQKPLVTILTPLSGPTAPTEDLQWNKQNVPATSVIPDNSAPGVNSDAITTLNNGNCSAMFDLKIAVNITHPEPGDLRLTLSALSADGSKVVQSVLLFDGPVLARTNSMADLTSMLSQDFKAGQLLNNSYCGRWRLNVADVVANKTGTLNGWTLKIRTAWFPFVHDRSYYARLLFGDNSKPAPNYKPVVNDYYKEVSRNNFRFVSAGIYGPVTWTTWRNATDDSRVTDVIHLLEDQGFNFAAYDSNHNGTIDNDELEVLALDNILQDAGSNRPAPKGCVQLKRSPIKVCAQVALVTEEVDFETLTHELSHSLGTVDLYSSGCFSEQLTLMSCTISSADNPRSVYLDPWHRKKLGWVFPYAVGGNSYQMGDEFWTDFWGGKTRPAVFYPLFTHDEYYLFEFRGARSYDNGVAAIGIAAWHVSEDGKGNPAGSDYGSFIYSFSPIRGKSDPDVGGTGVWTPDNGRFQVKMKDGSYLPYSFWVEQPQNSPETMILHWDSAPANNAPPSIQILQPKDGSSGPIGFGPTTVLEAAVKDARGGTDGVRVTWMSDVDGPLATGIKTAASFLTPGTRNITAIATDKYGASARATVKFTATATPAIASIFSPANGQTFSRNQPINLNGKGSTSTTFAVDCKFLTWTVDRQPGWTLNGCQGSPSFNLTGALKITLTVRLDPNNPALDGTASVTVNLVDPPPSSPPVVTITAPADYSLWSSDTSTVAGTVSDPQGGPVTYRWTVQPTGGNEVQLSTAASFSWRPDTTFANSTTFDLRLYGTNNRGQTSVAKQTHFVQFPPR